MNLFKAEAVKAPFSRPLHAARGIAALVVVNHHIVERVMLASYDDVWSNGWPFNGGAAVTLFFVLSGLVLGVSLAKLSPMTAKDMLQYLVRRAFRIFPLIFFAVSTGALYLFFIDHRMPFPSEPVQYGGITVSRLIAGYVGYSQTPDPPIWSLFVEIIASLLLLIMVASGRSKTLIAATGLVLAVASAFRLGLKHDWNLYMIDFFVGVTVLWWGRKAVEPLGSGSALTFWCLFAALLLSFYLPRTYFEAYADPRFNALEVVCIAPVLAIMFFMPERFTFLQTRPFQFLGDVSYSLYLTHWFIVVGASNLLYMLVPSAIGHPLAASIGLIAVVAPACLLVATLTHRYVELNGIALGRVVSQKLLIGPTRRVPV